MARVLGLHHVAFAHSAADEPHRNLAQLLGLSVEHSEDVDGFTERMLPVGEGYLQTLESTGAGVVTDFVARRGSALHHIGLEVDDVEEFVQELRSAGVRVLDGYPRLGGMGTTIAFIHPSEFGGLLVELVERETT